MSWTDLSAFVYLAPFTIAAFAVLIWGACDDLASHAGVRCDGCGMRFKDREELDKHLDVKKEAGRPPEFKKAA